MPPLPLTPHSCGTCQRLVIADTTYEYSGRQEGEKKNFVHFNFTLAELLVSAQDCDLCVYLHRVEWVHRSSITEQVLAGRA